MRIENVAPRRRSVFVTIPIVLVVLAGVASCAHDEPTSSTTPAAGALPRARASDESFAPTLNHKGTPPPAPVDPNVEHPAEHGRRIVAPSAQPTSPAPTPSNGRP